MLLDPDAKAADQVHQVHIVNDVNCKNETVSKVSSLSDDDYDDLREKSYLFKGFGRRLDLNVGEVFG